jgi:hypothetical protein
VDWGTAQLIAEKFIRIQDVLNLPNDNFLYKSHILGGVGWNDFNRTDSFSKSISSINEKGWIHTKLSKS